MEARQHKISSIFRRGVSGLEKPWTCIPRKGLHKGNVALGGMGLYLIEHMATMVTSESGSGNPGLHLATGTALSPMQPFDPLNCRTRSSQLGYCEGCIFPPSMLYAAILTPLRKQPIIFSYLTELHLSYPTIHPDDGVCGVIKGVLLARKRKIAHSTTSFLGDDDKMEFLKKHTSHFGVVDLWSGVVSWKSNEWRPPQQNL